MLNHLQRIVVIAADLQRRSGPAVAQNHADQLVQRPLVSTGALPSVFEPDAIQVLRQAGCQPQDRHYDACAEMVRVHMDSWRRTLLTRFAATLSSTPSCKVYGGMADEQVEQLLVQTYEMIHVRHVDKVILALSSKLQSASQTVSHAKGGFNTHASSTLEYAFSLHDHINTAETAYLARVSGITHEQCRTWFQNRRQRHRNLEKRAAEVGTTPPPPLRGAPHHPRKISALPRRSDTARAQGTGQPGDVKREGGEIAPAAPPRAEMRAGKPAGRERKIKGLPKRGYKKGGNREQVQEDGGAEEVEQGLIVQEASLTSSSAPSISTASDGSYGTSPIFDSPIDMYNYQYPTSDVLVPHGLVFGEYSYDVLSQQGQDGQEGLCKEIGEEVNRFAGMGFELSGLGQVGQAGGQSQQLGGQSQAQANASFGAAISQLNLAYDSSIPFPFPFANDTINNIPLLSAYIPPTPRGSSTRASISASVRSTPSMQSSAGAMDNMLDPFAAFNGVVGVEVAEAAMEEWARLVSSPEMDVVMSTVGSQTGEGEGEMQRTEGADAGVVEGEQQEEELDLSVLEELQSYIDIPDSPSSSALSSLPPSYSSSPTNGSPGDPSPAHLPAPIESSGPSGASNNSSNANTAGVYDINAVLLDALNANVDFGAGAFDLGILSQFAPTVTPQQAQTEEGINMGVDMDLDMEGNMSMFDLLPFFKEQDSGFGLDLSFLPPVTPLESTAPALVARTLETPVVVDERASLGHGTPLQPLPLPFVLPPPPATREQLPDAPACSTLNYEAMFGGARPNLVNMADAACRREMAGLEAAMVGMSDAELSAVLAGTGVGVQPQGEDRQGGQWCYVDPAEGLHSAHIYGAARSAPQGSGNEQQQEQDIGMDVEVEQEQNTAEPGSPWTLRRIPSNASFTSNTSADSYASYASYSSTASDASASSSVSAASTSTRIITPAGAHTPAVVLHTPAGV